MTALDAMISWYETNPEYNQNSIKKTVKTTVFLFRKLPKLSSCAPLLLYYGIYNFCLFTNFISLPIKVTYNIIKCTKSSLLDKKAFLIVNNFEN